MYQHSPKFIAHSEPGCPPGLFPNPDPVTAFRVLDKGSTRGIQLDLREEIFEMRANQSYRSRPRLASRERKQLLFGCALLIIAMLCLMYLARPMHSGLPLAPPVHQR
jgi:hypothetical protein